VVVPAVVEVEIVVVPMIVVVMITVILVVVAIAAIYTYLDLVHQFQLYVIELDWWPFQLHSNQANPPNAPKLKPRVWKWAPRDNQ
jgi:hypothetical protein